MVTVTILVPLWTRFNLNKRSHEWMKLDLGLIRDTALLHLQQTLTSSIFIISFIFYTSDFSTPTFTTKKWNVFFYSSPSLATEWWSWWGVWKWQWWYLLIREEADTRFGDCHLVDVIVLTPNIRQISAKHCHHNWLVFFQAGKVK